jgi:hypothetical protein
MNIQKISLTLTFAALTTLSLNAQAQDVNVIVGGEIKPGVYGRVEIGTQPPPPVIYRQPVIIQRPVVVSAAPAPIYMHVPPGHAKKWSKHCHKYNACSQPVYFVKGDDHAKGHKHGKRHGKKHDD